MYLKYFRSITTCSKSGHIKIWKCKKTEELELITEGNVSKMKKCPNRDGIIGLGGEKNDLKLWDVNKKCKVFCAKNVKKDSLELEIPIWVTDLTFLPNNENLVAVSTRHGHVIRFIFFINLHYFNYCFYY